MSLAMPTLAEPMTPTAFRDALFAARVLIATGEDGLYGRSAAFEGAALGVEALMGRIMAGDGAEVMRFPPGMPRSTLERSGYMKGFPQLAGTVGCFCGDEPAHRRLLATLEAGEDWTGGQVASEVALIPAACYPVYGQIAARGPLPDAGATVDVASWCFRHEPSPDPARMQMFRIREQVRLGLPAQVATFRARWLERIVEAAEQMRLPHEVDVANDPFFGRAGRIMASSQRDQALKHELLIPVSSDMKPTACASVNIHHDGIALRWGLVTGDGAAAHTACCGFGIERLTLALFRHHGMDPTAWPAAVREAVRP